MAFRPFIIFFPFFLFLVYLFWHARRYLKHPWPTKLEFSTRLLMLGFSLLSAPFQALLIEVLRYNAFSFFFFWQSFLGSIICSAALEIENGCKMRLYRQSQKRLSLTMRKQQ